MGATRITVESIDRHWTRVSVDGRFVYETQQQPITVADHIQRLIRALNLDNTEVVSSQRSGASAAQSA